MAKVKYSAKTGKKLKKGESTTQDGKTYKAGDTYTGGGGGGGGSSSSSSPTAANVINFNPNTGAKLREGQIVINAATGKALKAGEKTTDAKGNTYTQGQSINTSSSSSGFRVGELPTSSGKSSYGTGTRQNPLVNANGLAGQYQALLGASPEEQSAQKALQDQQNAFRTGTQNLAEQPIGMSFISGQQQSLENRNVNLQIPLQQKLALAQEKRRASLDSVKFQLDRQDKETARQDDLSAAQQSRQDNLNAKRLDENYRRDTLINTQSKKDTQVVEDDSGNKKIINLQTGEVVKDLGGGTLNTSDKASVKAFQLANGLVPDGIVGPKTRAKMAEKGMTTKSGGSGKGTTTKDKKNDIASAVLNFRSLMAKNNQRGIDPTIYQGLGNIIKSKYGASAVLELDKALTDAGLSVDNDQTGY